MAKKAVSLVDTLRWTDDTGLVCEFDGKGEQVDLPDDEFDRLEKAGSVAKPRSKDAKAAKDAADDADPEPDES